MNAGALTAKFAALAAQRLQRLENLVVRLEQGGDRGDGGREAQRELHTLKGEARILGLLRTERLAHALEELLHRALAEDPFPRDAARRILLGLDRLSEVISGIDRGVEPDMAVDAVVREIELGDEAAASTPGAPEDARGREPGRAGAGWSAAVEGPVWGSAELDELTRLLGELRVQHARWRGVAFTLRTIDERIAGRAAQLLEGSERAGEDEEIRGLAREGHAAARAHLFEHESLLERLDHLTWSLRVLPIDPHLSRHPRAVRDLAVALGKNVRLDIVEHGARVERPVLEALDEIAVHLLRNAVDHGIEAPGERVARGKPEVGRVTLAVKPLGAHVELTVEDDGSGIDPAALRKAAVATRALSPEAAEAAADAEIVELLFAPGFTTRKQVSDVSGRGVGLDAVRDRAAALGGTVTVESTPGRGAIFRAIVPARATMTRVLVVSSGGSRIALPAQSVRAVMGLERSEVEVAAGALFVRREDEPLPLLDLARSMGERSEGTLPDPLTVLVVTQRWGHRAFLVDRVVGTRDAVLVPPGRMLEGHAFIRSIALLHDGEIALAIDPGALPGARIPVQRLAGEVGQRAAQTQRVSVLVVDDSEVTRDVISEMLRGAGLDVVEAVDGRQALERFAEARPALVITDLQMPVMDGFALLHAVREHADWKDTPMIVVSTLGSEADRQQAARAGADAYVIKSDLRRDVLLEVISRFVHAGSGSAA